MLIPPSASAGVYGVLLGALLLAVACTPEAQRPPARQRVVSLSPNTTEALYAIGAEGVLVGRSRHCDYPEQARQLPAVGGFADPSIEAIVALRPTLVVGARGPAGPSLAKTLAVHGIDTYFPEVVTVADIGAVVRGLGKRVGRSGAAEQMARRIAEQVEHIAAPVRDKPPIRVVMVFDTSPIVVAGPGGFPDELLRLARGHNLVTAGGAYPVVGLERLLALDPEVIIDASVIGASEPGGPTRSRLPTAPGWRELKAVKARRVGVLRSSAALRPGPRIAEGLADVLRALRNTGNTEEG